MSSREDGGEAKGPSVCESLTGSRGTPVLRPRTVEVVSVYPLES